MVEDAQISVAPLEDDQHPVPRTYFIDPNAAEASRRSLSVLIAGRQCYMCRQAFEADEVIRSDPQDFIDQVAAHCSQQQDYLLPDTPIKEAVFRVLLARGNEPMDADQISGLLVEKWAMTPFPRSISAPVVQRLLDHSDYYCISATPTPEPEVDAET